MQQQHNRFPENDPGKMLCFSPKASQSNKETQAVTSFSFILCGAYYDCQCYAAEVLLCNTCELDHLKKGGGMTNSATSGDQTKSGVVFHYTGLAKKFVSFFFCKMALIALSCL